MAFLDESCRVVSHKNDITEKMDRLPSNLDRSCQIYVQEIMQKKRQLCEIPLTYYVNHYELNEVNPAQSGLKNKWEPPMKM